MVGKKQIKIMQRYQSYLNEIEKYLDGVVGIIAVYGTGEIFVHIYRQRDFTDIFSGFIISREGQFVPKDIKRLHKILPVLMREVREKKEDTLC